MAEDAPRPFCSSGPRIRQIPLQSGPIPDLKDHGSAFADLRTREIEGRPSFPACPPEASNGLLRLECAPARTGPRLHRRRAESPRGAVPTIPASRGRAPSRLARPRARFRRGKAAQASRPTEAMPFGHLGGERGAPNRKPPPLTARLAGFRGAEGDPPGPFRTLRALLIGAGLSGRPHPGSGAPERALQGRPDGCPAQTRTGGMRRGEALDPSLTEEHHAGEREMGDDERWCPSQPGRPERAVAHRAMSVARRATGSKNSAKTAR